jgi:hypothetical protein
MSSASRTAALCVKLPCDVVRLDLSEDDALPTRPARHVQGGGKGVMVMSSATSAYANTASYDPQKPRGWLTDQFSLRAILTMDQQAETGQAKPHMTRA